MSTKPPERPPRSEVMTGLFRDRLSAERAYDTLRARGYTDADINVLMTDETRTNWYPTDDAATDLSRKAGTKTMARAGVGGAIGTAVGAERATMENRCEVDRSGDAGLRREDGTNWRGLGMASLALMLVLAAAWVTRRRGQGERIAAAEARMEPKPVIY